jgi:hypothetical protein
MAGTPTAVAQALARLQADSALAGILTGGLYDRSLKRTGPGATPDAYAPTPPHQPRPAGVLIDDGDDADPQGFTGGHLGFCSFWCYAPPTTNGRAAIANAIDRARHLLVGWQFATGNGTGGRFETVGQRLGVRDDPVDEGRVLDRIRFTFASYWPYPETPVGGALVAAGDERRMSHETS